MDDVRIYTRALSTAEIAQLYGGNVTTVSGGQILYNGISMPVNFPPPTTPTQALRTPYYINNGPRVLPIDVGRQLFVDDFLIESTTLAANPASAVDRSESPADSRKPHQRRRVVRSGHEPLQAVVLQRRHQRLPVYVFDGRHELDASHLSRCPGPEYQ